MHWGEPCRGLICRFSHWLLTCCWNYSLLECSPPKVFCTSFGNEWFNCVAPVQRKWCDISKTYSLKELCSNSVAKQQIASWMHYNKSTVKHLNIHTVCMHIRVYSNTIKSSISFKPVKIYLWYDLLRRRHKNVWKNKTTNIEQLSATFFSSHALKVIMKNGQPAS